MSANKKVTTLIFHPNPKADYQENKQLFKITDAEYEVIKQEKGTTDHARI